MKILFLDIDGVLNDHSRNASGVCGLKPECVQHLNDVLAAHKDLKLVISSAWRYIIYGGDMTLKGFECMLRIGGLDCDGRLIGITPRDEEVTSRGQQVKWSIERLQPSRYLIVDDMTFDFAKCGLGGVFTDPGVGLTRKEADAIIAHFANV